MADKLIRILYVDDNNLDRELVRDALEKEHGGFKLYEAASATEFKKMFAEREYDLILSDFHILGFEGLQVLDIVKAKKPRLPVILVTGTGSEEVAVEAMKRGAADYVLKTPSHIQRLPQAIHAVLETERMEGQQELALKALEESETRYRSLTEASPDMIYVIDQNDRVLYVNKRAARQFGKTPEQVMGKARTELFPPEIAEDQAKGLQYVLSTAESFSAESFTSFPGGDIWLDTTLVPIQNKDGMVDAVMGVSRDITERKKAEITLVQLKKAVESSGEVIFMTDTKGIFTFINPEFTCLYGYTAEEVVGRKTPRILKSGHQKTEDYEKFWISLLSGQEVKREVINKTKDGRLITVSGTANPIKNDSGITIGFVDIQLDISARKQTEQALRDAEFFKQAIISHSPIGISVRNSLGELQMANAAWLKIWNYSEKEYQELLQERYETFFFDERDQYLEGYQADVCRIYEKGGTLYLPDLKVIEHRHGKTEWVSQYYYAIMNDHDRVEQVVALTEDITERKQAERLTQESEAKYRSLFDNIPDGIFSTSTDGKLLAANPALVKMFGSDSLEELLKKNVSDLYVNPSDRDASLNKINEFGEAHNLEVTFQRKDGSHIIAIENARAIIDQNGRVTSYEGTLTDITERKQAEEALRESENRFRTTLENMELIAIQLDGEGKITYVNPYFIKLSGYSRNELIGKDWSNTFIPSPIQLELKQFLNNAIFMGDIEHQHENPIILKDGTERLIRWNNSLMNSPGGLSLGMTSIGEDITVKKEAEKAILRQLNELTVLQLVARASSRASSSDELITNVTQIISTSLYPDSCGVLLFDQQSQGLRPQHSNIGVTEEDFQDFNNIIIRLGEGVVGRVAASLEPLNIPDVQKDANYLSSNKETRSELCVPISINDQLLGVINAESKIVNAFTENDERLLLTIAGTLATALEKLRLFEQTSRRLEFVQVLRKIDMAISGGVDLDLTLDILLGQVLNHMNVDAADILLFNANSRTLEYKSGIGFRTNVLHYTLLQLGEGLAGKSALEKKVIHIPDLAVEDGVLANEIRLASEGFVSYLSVPLIAKGLVKGVMEIFNRTPLSPGQEWMEQVEILARQAAIAIDNVSLFDDLQSSNQELMIAYDATIEGWSKALDLRDSETEGHTQRVVEITLKIAKNMKVSDSQLLHIRRGALLHDMGKIGVPDEILRKTGPLSDDEWLTMRKHPQYAFDMFAPISYLEPALDIPYCHHEKWDGSGYPRGLKGDLIPLSARIFAVVDVYDALTSDRSYRKAWSQEKALEYIREQSGKHFDPKVVEVFLRLLPNL